jgi:hypothetical protein
MELETIPNAKSSVLCIDDEQSNLTVRKLPLESAGYWGIEISPDGPGVSLSTRHRPASLNALREPQTGHPLQVPAGSTAPEEAHDEGASRGDRESAR